MTKVVFVGDEPSSTNIDPSIAFVGSRSLRTLVKWIKFLEPDYYICLNSNTEGCLDAIEKLYKNGFIVIALGKEAEKRCVCHFVLPHPSGRNRKLNDKEYIDKCLANIKRWINE
jgi:hypothetical protein